MNQVVSVRGFDANLAPDAFHRWATHYYKCKQDFRCPHRFSPVPYFLLCRAIELAIKAKHLRHKTQDQVKDQFGHDLVKAHQALDTKEQILSGQQLNVLQQANNIYATKGFEYFEPQDAATGFSRYPDLQLLDQVAKKLIG